MLLLMTCARRLLMQYYGDDPNKQKEAVSLFRFGAEQNVPQAQHYLALMYEYGFGRQHAFLSTHGSTVHLGSQI
jgi:TPR repeat protein